MDAVEEYLQDSVDVEVVVAVAAAVAAAVGR